MTRHTHTLTLNDADLTLSGDAEEGIYCCIQSELAEELTITGTATLSDADRNHDGWPADAEQCRPYHYGQYR